MPLVPSPDREVARIARDCLIKLECMGLAGARLADQDAGHGVAELVVQAAGQAFFVDCRATRSRPSRVHLHRQARWTAQGAEVLCARSSEELARALREHFERRAR